MTEFKIKDFVLSFLRKNIPLTVLLVVFIFLSALSGLVPPFVLRYLIDTYLPNHMNGYGYNIWKLLLISGFYFFTYFLVAIFEIVENYLITMFGQRMIHSLRYEMIKKAHRMKASYFTHHGTGETQSRIMDDVYAIETLFATGIVSLLVSFIKIIGILVSIFTFSWKLGLIILILIPIIYFITRQISKTMLKSNIRNRKCLNAQANRISETIHDVETIQLLDKEDYMEDRYHSLIDESYKFRDQTGIMDALFSPIVEMIKALLIGLVSVLVCLSMKNPDNFLSLGITVGTFAASLTLISNLFSPIQSIGKEIQTMQEGVSGLKRVEQFMNEKEINDRNPLYNYERIFAEKKKKFLSFSKLTFRYDDGDSNVIENLSFDINEMEKVTFVGRTGAGKTTLFKLILGIETPTSGIILLNGYDVSSIPDSEKRKIFGYVEQGFSYVKGNIMDQITLGDENYSLEDVRRVMKEVYLDDYVTENIPNGYMAEFHEEDFSRGQLQLLSLARALLSNPRILLLDEISANLDSKTENMVIMALSHSTEKRTVLSISHRLSDELGFDRTITIK
jgi:ATP-binding cassette, subfamily B, multidrug efflux pump